MFIKKADTKRLMKQAYKGIGLRLANDGRGLIITGRNWYMQVLHEYLPKETKGDIIALTGELPANGEQWLCDPDGNQQEIFHSYSHVEVYRLAMEAEAAGNRVDATDIIITDGEKLYRVCRSEDGKCHLIPETINQMCSALNCEDDEDMYGCYADSDGALYFRSDYMAFCIVPSLTEDLQDRLKEIARLWTEE